MTESQSWLNVDETHDPELRSWVKSANTPDTDFPIQNLPLGVFRRKGDLESTICVAIGEGVLDLRACAAAGLFSDLTPATATACVAPNLNELMALGTESRRALRQCLSELLREGRERPETRKALIRGKRLNMQVPATIGDYTDFYASVEHATNVGSMFRPDNPLLPNYKYVPIGYHGRASSIVPSGTPVTRPVGQLKADADPAPVFGPSTRLDYECEVGAYIGTPNDLGRRIPLASAEEHLFGLTLLNDWSARDIQAWEYQPLGPFLAKNFATTVSPWIVTLEALAPFRTPARVRPPNDPAALPYLSGATNDTLGGFALTLEVYLCTAAMRETKAPRQKLSRASFSGMYWTMAQMLTHHASNGCNLRSGDLIASGTVSGEEPDSRGSMLELAWRGQHPIALTTGETRAFLHDGDEVILRGYCAREGFRRIGFGDCSGTVQPATAA